MTAKTTAELSEQVYDQLRELARRSLRRERRGHTLQATALVHEAFLKMAGTQDIPWRSRRHFFKAAGDAMRKILIDHARVRGSSKRGGGRQRVELGSVADLSECNSEEILTFEDVFRRLEKEAPQYAEVIRLRFFAGLSVDETALALETSASSVDRRWALARTWLFREMERAESD